MQKNNYIGNKIYRLVKKIFPYNRSLTGNGNRKTLNRIKDVINKLKIIEYKSGKKVFDWKVPPEWNVNDAYIKCDGKKIVDFKKNNLHLLGYSKPINKNLDLKNLKKYLHTDKEHKNAIPYITSYYKKKWGFCVSEKFKEKLKKAKYQVFIDASFKKNGSLSIGELKIKGSSKKEIIISTNICHPSMANHETSGIAILTYIAKYLSSKKNNYSYRILFLPETVGTISYLHHNQVALKKNFVAGFHLTCLGSDGNYSMIQTKYKNSYSDYIAKKILRKKVNYKVYTFQCCGSDERQYNYPGINLSVVTLTRSIFAQFKEYHTSLDNMQNLKIKSLKQSYQYIYDIINLLEHEFKVHIKKKNIDIFKKNKKKEPLNKKYFVDKKKDVKVFANTKCEPFLSKRNLYRTTSNTKVLTEHQKNLFQILYYSDGLRVSQISKYLGKKPDILFPIIKILKKNKLIKFN